MASLSFATPKDFFNSEDDLDARVAKLVRSWGETGQIIFSPHFESEYEELTEITLRVAEIHSAAPAGRQRILMDLLNVLMQLMGAWENEHETWVKEIVDAADDDLIGE